MSHKDYQAGLNGRNPHYTMDLDDFRRGQDAARRQEESTARAWQGLLDQQKQMGAVTHPTSGSSGRSTTPNWVLTASKWSGLIVAVAVGIWAYQTTTIQPLILAGMAGGVAGIATILGLELLFHVVVAALWLAKAVAVLIVILFGVQLFTGSPLGSNAVDFLRGLVQSLAG